MAGNYWVNNARNEAHNLVIFVKWSAALLLYFVLIDRDEYMMDIKIRRYKHTCACIPYDMYNKIDINGNSRYEFFTYALFQSFYLFFCFVLLCFFIKFCVSSLSTERFDGQDWKSNFGFWISENRRFYSTFPDRLSHKEKYSSFKFALFAYQLKKILCWKNVKEMRILSARIFCSLKTNSPLGILSLRDPFKLVLNFHG